MGPPSASRALKVILLGQPGVGKTALAVRFATKRFIGEYDCEAERVYKVEDSGGSWEIVDPPGCPPGPVEPKLRWADAIILVYSVTDRVSFEETSRLRFLVSHAKRGRKIPQVVLLVGNKADLSGSPGERMVASWEGRRRAEDIEAHGFYEISVRESIDQVRDIFKDISRLWIESQNSLGNQSSPFRGRASTDGRIETQRLSSPHCYGIAGRRFSISARGAP
ncbi:ras-related and estrogen-regulated growth inhibitor [Orussus abietinus]|uniref:ras-related and estrogen-regulated growth inhibitor n=1 Tax=Orussus abietinus TaxID=222816 RepID=UPI00062541CF|nr:ras-related and estrogen-regulated growth inhibitor [Orussus abietinus]